MKKVCVIVGPTASGKTKLSIELAKAYDMEIINGDSVQVYKRLDIGSAKIKEDEKEGISHVLIDYIDPIHQYSVYDFQQDVRLAIEKIDHPLIVGGTGLYIKAALYDYEFEEMGRDDSFEQIYQNVSTEMIYQELMKLDKDIKIDSKNRRRVLRALEQAKLGYLRSEKDKKDKLLYDALIIYLDLDRVTLEERLIKRLDHMIEEGFIEEVASLLEDGINKNVIGYRELAQYLKGELTLIEAKALIIKKSKQLAKKQKTWFKNQMHPHILDANSQTLVRDCKSLIDDFLKE